MKNRNIIIACCCVLILGVGVFSVVLKTDTENQLQTNAFDPQTPTSTVTNITYTPISTQEGVVELSGGSEYDPTKVKLSGGSEYDPTKTLVFNSISPDTGLFTQLSGGSEYDPTKIMMLSGGSEFDPTQEITVELSGGSEYDPTTWILSYQTITSITGKILFTNGTDTAEFNLSGGSEYDPTIQQIYFQSTGPVNGILHFVR